MTLYEALQVVLSVLLFCLMVPGVYSFVKFMNSPKDVNCSKDDKKWFL